MRCVLTSFRLNFQLLSFKLLAVMFVLDFRPYIHKFSFSFSFTLFKRRLKKALVFLITSFLKIQIIDDNLLFGGKILNFPKFVRK